MRHLQTGSLKPTFDVEPFVRLRAIEDALVAPDILRDMIERLDNLQPQLLPLLVCSDGNVFDMSHHAQGVDTVVGIHEVRLTLALKRDIKPTISAPPRELQSRQWNQ